MSADGSTATDEVSERSSKAERVEHLTVEERVARAKARAKVPAGDSTNAAAARLGSVVAALLA